MERSIVRGILDALGALPLFATAPLYRRWHMHWGATKDEVSGRMPGDDIVQKASFNATRAITIDAPPDKVWPWIVQMGYRRTLPILAKRGIVRTNGEMVDCELNSPFPIGRSLPMVCKRPTKTSVVRIKPV